MGIYNCAPYLQEALDSLYAQTFQDFEIVLCDDGSTDDTYAIAQNNAKRHPCIKLLQNEHNLGLNATLNKCLTGCEGEYIARMDGDDISLPTRFEKEVDFLDNHLEYAIVSTPMFYFDEKGVFKESRGGNEPKLSDFAKATPFCHAPCMVKKRAFDDVDGYSVSDRLLRVEDYHLWIKMYAKGYKGFRLSEPLYMMRDDRNAAKRRTFKTRCNEAYVKYLACKTLHLPLHCYFYCLKPILIGLMPSKIYNYFHMRSK